MGRPLNKKYFGNRNYGNNGEQISNGLSNSRNYGDDHIGGEGLAAYTLDAQKGSLVINALYPQPTLVVPAPTIPGGVQATATVTWEVDTITTSGLAGHGYVTTTGGATTLTGLAGVTLNITAVGSGQGEVQTMVPVNRGSFTSIPVVATTYQIVGGDGNQQATVTYRVKSIVTVVAGSGYTGSETFSWDDGGSHSGTMPGAPTVALTADTGAVGSATNQENAILMTARLTGGSATTVDIIRQVSAHRYKVTDGTRTGIVKLKSSVATAAGEGSIRLIDTDGGTYFATKLTSRKAVITRGTGVQDAFVTGASVKWNMTAATADSLKIDNA